MPASRSAARPPRVSPRISTWNHPAAALPGGAAGLPADRRHRGDHRRQRLGALFGEAHASIKTQHQGTLSSKAENSKVVPFEVKDADAERRLPKVDLYADARAKTGVRFTLALYGVLGPYAKVSAVAALIADPLKDPCWDFHVGLERARVLVKTPSLPVIGALTFLDWGTGPLPLFDKSVASGTCDVTRREERAAGWRAQRGHAAEAAVHPVGQAAGCTGGRFGSRSVLAYPTGFPSLIRASTAAMWPAGGRTVWPSSTAKADRWKQLASSAGRAALAGSVPSADAGLVTLIAPGLEHVRAGEAVNGPLERCDGVTLPTTAAPRRSFARRRQRLRGDG